MLWLWLTPAAAALIQSLAWELSYASGMAIKRKKKKGGKEERRKKARKKGERKEREERMRKRKDYLPEEGHSQNQGPGGYSI